MASVAAAGGGGPGWGIVVVATGITKLGRGQAVINNNGLNAGM